MILSIDDWLHPVSAVRQNRLLVEPKTGEKAIAVLVRS